MARGIQEGDHAFLVLHVVGADVLGDATGFTGRHLGLADIVQQRGLAVVDVAHDGHDRRARFFLDAGVIHQIRQIVFQRLFLTFHQLGGMAHFLGEQYRRFLVDVLIHGGHFTHLHHCLDEFLGLDVHPLGQLSHGDGFGNLYVVYHFLRGALEPVLFVHGAAHLAMGHADRALLATAAAGLTLLGAITGFNGITDDGGPFIVLLFCFRRLGLTATLLQLLGDALSFLGGAAGSFFLGFLAGFRLLLAARLLGLTLLALFLFALGTLLGGFFLRHLLGGRLGHGGTLGLLLAGFLFAGLALLLGAGLGFLLAAKGVFLFRLALGFLFLGLTLGGFLGFDACLLFGGQALLLQALLFFHGGALHVGAFLAHFHVHRFRLTRGTGGLDGAGGAALQGNLLGLRVLGTMGLAQVREQLLLLFVRDAFTGVRVWQSGFLHLREQCIHRDANHVGQFLYGRFCHVSNTLLSASWWRPASNSGVVLIRRLPRLRTRGHGRS